MSQIVKELSSMEQELATKLEAIRKTRELFASRDAVLDPNAEKPGSLEPTATDRLRTLFADGTPRTMKEIFAGMKEQGYKGPEQRLRGAVRRLEANNELKRRGEKFQRPKAA